MIDFLPDRLIVFIKHNFRLRDMQKYESVKTKQDFNNEEQVF